MGIFPKTNIDIVNKSEYVTHVIRLETNKLQVCIGQIETRKRRWPFSEEKYWVHDYGEGIVESRNLCDIKTVKQFHGQRLPTIGDETNAENKRP